MIGPGILHLSTSRKAKEICQQCFIHYSLGEINKKEGIETGEMDLTCTSTEVE